MRTKNDGLKQESVSVTGDERWSDPSNERENRRNATRGRKTLSEMMRNGKSRWSAETVS